MESWKVYPELTNYEVSDTGLVRNAKTKKLLKLTLDRYGYYYVGLYANKKKYHRTVHRLVALTFIDNPENYPVVDHIDQNRTNNLVSNLRWVDYKGNSRNAVSNKKIKICDFEGKTIKTFDTIVEASEYYNIPNDKLCVTVKINSLLKGYVTYDEP